MNETPDFFQDNQGALTVALRANPEPKGVLRIVPGPMARPAFPTNLSGGVESRHALQLPSIPETGSITDLSIDARLAAGRSGSSAPPAQLFTNQKEGGDAKCAALAEFTGSGIAPPIRAASNAAPRSNPLVAAQDNPKFDGESYSPKLDQTRLKGQLERVQKLMSDSVWRSLAEIADKTGCSEASASARLRDLRKPKFGLWTVERRRIRTGWYLYQVRGRGL